MSVGTVLNIQMPKCFINALNVCAETDANIY